ncbi:MAG TPA: GNAT family N-acetyltransferase [Acidimicrobiales bacterium]|nr:GNAT family N-acetyltransferase [Acidimicrobiales bacterium]
MDDGRTCPACGSDDLQPSGWATARRAVCGHCGRCWEDGGRGAEVDSLGCPGCPRRGTCEACPTPLAESLTQRHVLLDGEIVEIRPLRYGDRFELAAAFTGLSPESRRSRFFDLHDELDPDELEYLTNIDYRDHFAVVAILPGRPPPNGVGVGRYVRDPADPALAEVAVVVVDDHQRRGIGTLLTRTLGERAVGTGIRTFVCYVQWKNAVTIDMLTAEGARVLAAEPGVARVELDLPDRVDEVPDSYLHRLIATFAERARLLGHLLDAEPAGRGH